MPYHWLQTIESSWDSHAGTHIKKTLLIGFPFVLLHTIFMPASVFPPSLNMRLVNADVHCTLLYFFKNTLRTAYPKMTNDLEGNYFTQGLVCAVKIYIFKHLKL